MKPLKERLPLIDAAIEHHKSWPKHNLWSLVKVQDNGRWLYAFTDYTITGGKFVCTRNEFNERKAQWLKLYKWAASTLSQEKAPSLAEFISHEMTSGNCRRIAERDGFNWQDTLEQRHQTEAKEQLMKYEYGVEYKNNGEKPDLPDDVEVECFCGALKEWYGHVKPVSWWGWSVIEKFKIVDGRYKPKEQDMNWYEKGELPPVGVECEMLHPGIKAYGWQKVEIKAYFDEFVVIKGHTAIWPRGYSQTAIDEELEFRPLPTETDELIEQMERSFESTGCVFTNDYRALAQHLIGKGYRKTKPMSECEFCCFVGTHIPQSAAKWLYSQDCRFLDKGE